MPDKVQPDVARWEEEDWQGHMRLVDEEAFYRSTILRVIAEEIDRHDARAANARRNHLREKHAHKAAALVSLRARFEEAPR